MKVSILIHNLNRDTALSRCLSSVATQTYRPLEVTILDAGSTDHSEEIIDRAIKEMHRVGIEAKRVSCPPMGVCASRNLAASHASGALLCFIDNDATFSSQGSVSEAARLFAINPRVAVVSFRVLKAETNQIDRFGWVFRRPIRWSDKQFRTFSFTGGAFCIRAIAFREAGGFWDHLEYAREEEEMAWTLIDKGWEIIYSPSITIRHYPDSNGRTSLSQRRATELRNGILVLWRRVPAPLALLAIGGRICTMAVKSLREGSFTRSLLGEVPKAIQEWHKFNLQRHPIGFRGAWKYALLHFGIVDK